MGQVRPVIDTTPALCNYPHHKTPHTTEYGHLCAWCWGRLNHDLADTPDLTQYLRTLGTPNASARPLTTDPIHRGDPSENDPYPAPWHAADNLHADLASWAHLILEEHPQKLAGPHIPLTVGRTDTDTDPDTRQPYTSTPRPAPHLGNTAALVEWIATHLAWAVEQDWAVDMRTELGATVSTLKAKWPTAETQTRHVPDIPCPRCHRITLTYSPPVRYRAPFVVSCTNSDCNRIFSEDEWAEFVYLTTRRQA